MIRRAVITAVGVGVGIALGVWMVRKVERVQRSLTPQHLAQRAGDGVVSLGSRVSSALADGRQAIAAREAELRERFAPAG